MTMSEGFDPFADFGRTARLVQPHPLAPGGMQDALESAAEAEGEPAAEAAPESGRRAAEGEAKAPAARFDLLHGPQLAEPIPPLPWLCKGLGIMPGRVTLLAGYGGTGKTMLAQEMALAIAAGRGSCWGGSALQVCGAVVHIDYEQTSLITRWRYQRLAWAMGVDLAALGDLISLASMPRVYLTSKDAEEQLVRLCTGKVLCVIDNFRAACPGVDENKSEVRQYLDMLSSVTNRTGCTFIVLVHEGKEGKEPRRSAQRVRASSAVTDACQQLISCTADDGCVKIEPSSKTNMVKPAEPFRVRFEDVGVVDENTGSSIGLRIDLVPDEELASEKKDRSDEETERDFNTLVDQVYRCVQRNPGIGGAKPVSRKLRRNAQEVQDAFSQLAEDRRIENRGGKPPKGKWFVATGDDLEEGE